MDGAKDSYWATDDGVTTPELVLEFDHPIAFNIVRLRENLSMGQRVEGFAIDSWQGDAWVEPTRATSIGSCRLLRSGTTTATRIRLRILAASASPALSEWALFLDPSDADRTAQR